MRHFSYIIPKNTLFSIKKKNQKLQHKICRPRLSRRNTRKSQKKNEILMQFQMNHVAIYKSGKFCQKQKTKGKNSLKMGRAI